MIGSPYPAVSESPSARIVFPDSVAGRLSGTSEVHDERIRSERMIVRIVFINKVYRK
jgi:hypothetical protein